MTPSIGQKWSRVLVIAYLLAEVVAAAWLFNSYFGDWVQVLIWTHPLLLAVVLCLAIRRIPDEVLDFLGPLVLVMGVCWVANSIMLPLSWISMASA